MLEPLLIEAQLALPRAEDGAEDQPAADVEPETTAEVPS